MTFLLAPLSGAFAGACLCDHGSPGAAEIAPVSCCGIAHQQCCYDHRDAGEGTPYMAELSQQGRGDWKMATYSWVPLLPARISMRAVMREKRHCAAPADTRWHDLSQRQTWLI